jgi:transposase InsO family protein
MKSPTVTTEGRRAGDAEEDGGGDRPSSSEESSARAQIPHGIITDNGTNFTSKEFKSYCKSIGIKLNFASVAHPQTNGQVEKANGLICSGIKKRLLAPLKKPSTLG